ncbi:MAG TPA: signal peptidase I [Deltaproteobacteria bacterium]|nr:signal peptidase I [Deltaproteobacteria bacterium]
MNRPRTAELDMDSPKDMEQTQPPKSAVREWTEALIIALILALIIRAFLLQAYRIPSSSMEDTLLKGDHILATKYNYGMTIPFTTHKLWGKDIVPKRGDVIIFSFPNNTSVDFVKRVIGLPGDTIAVRNKKVVVNGRELSLGHEKYTDPYIVTEGPGRMRDNMPEVVVQKGHVFAMGDNRDQSYDSRFWGQLPVENIKGKALIIYFSYERGNMLRRLGRIGHLIK